MRKFASVLGVLVVSSTIFAASAETTTAQERADVALVEEEIRAVDEALEIHERAKERARKAVLASSLGQKYQKAKDEAAKAWTALKASRAHREYLGKDKMGIGTRPLTLEAMNSHLKERDRRREAYDMAAQKPKLLSKRSSLLADQCEFFMKRMTSIFLDDEIERAAKKKLDGLMRELKKIRKKDYAQI